MKKIELGRYNVWISGEASPETVRGIRRNVLGGSLNATYDGVRYLAITHPLFLKWNLAGGIKRQMAISPFVAAAFDAGKLTADAGIGWPAGVEAALIAMPLRLLGEALDLVENWQGDCLPALLVAACAQ